MLEIKIDKSEFIKIYEFNNLIIFFYAFFHVLLRYKFLRRYYMTNFSIFFAYADPGTGMLLWQVLAAFFLGASFYFKNIFRWIKNIFSKNKEK